MLNLKKLRESRGIREVHTRKPISDIISESYSLLYDCEDPRLCKIIEAHINDIKSSPKELSKLASNLATLKTLVVECNKKPLTESEGLTDPRIEIKDDTDLDIDTEMKEITDLTDEEPEEAEVESREDKTETAEEFTDVVQESNKASADQFKKFSENSRGKIFVKNLAKSTKLHESLKRYNLKESIGLYKAANSMMTQMAIELEHNESFKETFSVCSRVLGNAVSTLVESIRQEKPVKSKVLETLSKFSNALSLTEDEDIDDFIEWVDDEYEDSETDDLDPTVADPEEVSEADPTEVAMDAVSAVAPEDVPAVAQEIVDTAVSDEQVEENPPIEEEELTPEESEDLKKYLCLIRGCDEGTEEAAAEPTEEELDALEERVIRRRTIKKEGSKVSRRAKTKLNENSETDSLLRPFTDSDWRAYAGAENGPGGESPLIYEDGDYALIISGDADAASIEIDTEDEFYIFSHRIVSWEQAKKLATKLISNMGPTLDRDLIKIAGFEDPDEMVSECDE